MSSAENPAPERRQSRRSTHRSRGSHRRRSRSASFKALVVLVLLTQATALLGGCIDTGPSGASPDGAVGSEADGQDGPAADGSSLGQTGADSDATTGSTAEAWDELPPSMLERIGWDRASPLVSDPADGSESPAPKAPSDLPGLLARAGPEDVDRHPIPPAPAGDEPVLSALHEYADTLGVEIPADETLRTQIDDLRLQEPAKQALARLILAYATAVDLQGEAMADLSEEDHAVLRGDPAAVEARLGADPSPEAASQERSRLMASKVDLRKTFEAAELLSRAAEELRGPIGMPPAPRSDTTSAEQTSTSDASSPSITPSRSQSETSSPDGSNESADPWTKLRGALGALNMSAPELTLRETTLAGAYGNLTEALGIADAVQTQVPAFPPSLDRALALIVQAKADDVRADDGTRSARRLAKAAEEAEPTLRAWGQVYRVRDKLDAVRPDPQQVMNGSRLASRGPTDLVAAMEGVESDTDPASPPPLEDLLVEAGVSEGNATNVSAHLPNRVAEGLAYLLDAALDLRQARSDLFDGLDPKQRRALVTADEVQPLLSRADWSREEAERVETWARAFASIPDEDLEGFRSARVDALAQIREGRSILGEFHPDDPATLGSGTGDGEATTPTTHTASSHEPVQCPVQLDPTGLSDCEDDVWLQVPGRSIQAQVPDGILFVDGGRVQRDVGGILVTGFHSTTVRQQRVGAFPLLTLDLGGDDTYRISAGAAPDFETGPDDAGLLRLGSEDEEEEYLQQDYLSLSLDLAGDDAYHGLSDFPIAQGATDAPAATGILWDVAGDDEYRFADPPGLAQDDGILAQGTANDVLGLGLLVDQEGQDEYVAPDVWAQGAAGPGGTGMLVELGAGEDRLEAYGGQGSAIRSALSPRALLWNENGTTEYRTRQINGHYQGGATDRTGVADGANPGDFFFVGDVSVPNAFPAAFAGLVDLGGEGDLYSNVRTDPGATVVTHPNNSAERQDDALWVEGPGNLAGFGLDTTLDDEDSDGHSNLAELVAGSDPHDGNETPRNGDTGETLQSLVFNATDDGDEDGYPDPVEELTGSDPDDGDSTPISGFLIDDEALCHPTENQPCEPRSPPALCQHGDPQCLSILTLSGPGPQTYTHPAIVAIDLGGDDRYRAEIAGPALFQDPSALPRVDVTEDFGPLVSWDMRTISAGSVAFDVGGDDRYDTPELDHTQGSVGLRAFPPDYGSLDLGDSLIYNESRQPLGLTSLLLDPKGDDIYRAGRDSQGASPANRVEAGLEDFLGHHVRSSPAVGLLADLRGDDRYAADLHSQGYAGARGVGALADLDGDDRYTFATQALNADRSDWMNGVPGDLSRSSLALLWDDTGRDFYDSTAFAINATDRRPSNLPSFFATQGNGVGEGVAAFVDRGPETDIYRTLDLDAEMTDVSDLKNDRIWDNTWLGRFADAPSTAVFGDTDDDGAIGLAEMAAGTDPDDPDDSPGQLSEGGGGSTDPGDVEEAIIECMIDPPECGDTGDDGAPSEEPLIYAPGPGESGATGTDRLEDLGLFVPGLAIGGPEATTYDRYVPLVVDLGGNDTYTAPYIGGTAPHLLDMRNAPTSSGAEDLHEHPTTGAAVGREETALLASHYVSFVMDAGDGDDSYRPDRSACRDEVATTMPAIDTRGFRVGEVGGGSNPDFFPEAAPLCPSLGGAIGGVAVLADDGGRNTFETDLELSGTIGPTAEQPLADRDISLKAWGVSQGAGLAGGIGMLTTWDADNTFNVTTQVEARNLAVDGSTEAVARGVSQGAAEGGIGVLATFGAGNDTYAMDTDARASGPGSRAVAEDLAQGSALDGVGVLFDDGGDNVFRGPSGSAQGYAASIQDAGNDVQAAEGMQVGARGSVGLLWSGSGDDTFVGGARSQGSGAMLLLDDPTGFTLSPTRRVPAMIPTGTLLDTGGSDRYLLAEPTKTDTDHPLPCPVGDLQPSCSLSQGAAGQGGIGLLVDEAGADVYDAPERSRVQGAALLGSGTLLDLSGNDRYRALDRSQGYASHEDPSASATGGDQQPSTGVLYDVSGWDNYVLSGRGQGFAEAGGESGALIAALVDTEGEDRYRYGPADARTLEGCEADTSDQDLNGCLWTQVEGDGTDAGVGVDDETLGTAWAETVNAMSEVGMEPAVTLEASSHLVIGTVGLFGNVTGVDRSEVRRVDFFAEGSHRRVLLGNGTFLHQAGNTLVYSYRWTTPVGTGPSGEVFFPDGDYALNATVHLETGSEDSAHAPSTPGIESNRVDVTVDNPPDVEATLSTDAISPSLGQVSELAVDVSRDATCPFASCDPAPGGYLTVEAQGPESHGVFDGYVNRTEEQPFTTSLDGVGWVDGVYKIHVNLTDDSGRSDTTNRTLLVDGTPPTSTITTPAIAGLDHRSGTSLLVGWSAQDAGSGVEGVTLYRVDGEDGPTVVEPDRQPEGTLPIDDVATGDTLEFFTVATDALGNEEPAKAPKAITADFIRPTVSDVAVSENALRPGEEATYSARVDDVGSGLDRVEIHFDSVSAEMDPIEGQGDLYVFEGHPGLSPEEATTYTFEVRAVDAAGNAKDKSGTGVVDPESPEVEVTDVEYVDGDRTFPEGRPGVRARILVDTHDASQTTVQADLISVLEAVDEPPATIDCTETRLVDQTSSWRCETLLPDGLPDGTYDVPLTATDAAGNTNASTVASIVVDTQPVHLDDIRVADRGHDRFEARWNTSRPATAQVLFGKTAQLGEATKIVDANRTLQHSVTVDGLAPTTEYRFKAVSTSPSGVINESELRSVETSSAFELSLPGIEGGDVLTGETNVSVRSELLTGQDPVSLSLFVQDADRRASPIPIDEIELGSGWANVSLNTTQFADGDYRLILEGERVGDFAEVTSPVVRFDNTAPIVVPKSPPPSVIVPEATPPIEALVITPASDDAPPEDLVEITIDNTSVSPDAVRYEEVPDPDRRMLVVDLRRPLAAGQHLVNVSVADANGNRESVAWTFRVDISAPAVTSPINVTYLPGPRAAKPGGQVRLETTFEDVSDVESAAVDLRPLGSGLTPLQPRAEGIWQGTFTIPEDASSARHALPVLTKDGLNHTGEVGAVDILVDAEPPEIVSTSSEPTGFRSARLVVETDEPTRLEAAPQAGPGDAVTGDWNTTHRVTIPGLVPNQAHTYRISLTDGAGSAAVATRAIVSESDESPPSAAADPEAVSPDEGTVVVRWSAAKDNAGLDHYLVQRIVGDSIVSLPAVPADRTSLEDPDAPAGRPVTYRITPVDLAGHRGPSTEVTAMVEARPHLTNGTVTPRQGPSTEPFTFAVDYRHAGDVRPDRIVVVIGDDAHPLTPRDERASCRETCRYEASVPLEPTSSSGTSPEIRFVAEADDETVELPIDAPRVTAGPGGAGVLGTFGEGVTSPLTLGLIALAALGIGIGAWVFHRRRRW